MSVFGKLLTYFHFLDSLPLIRPDFPFFCLYRFDYLSVIVYYPFFLGGICSLCGNSSVSLVRNFDFMALNFCMDMRTKRFRMVAIFFRVTNHAQDRTSGFIQSMYLLRGLWRVMGIKGIL